MKQTSLIRYATVFVILLVTMLTLTLGIQPKLSEIDANTAALIQAQDQLQVQKEKLAQLVKLSSDRPALQAKVDALKNAIPEDLEISNFVRELNKNAAASKIKVTGLEIGEPKIFETPAQLKDDPELSMSVAKISGSSFYVIDLQMTLSGSFESVQSFMKEFQNNPRTLLVHNLSFVAGGTGGSGSTLSLDAQIFQLTN